jgi:hypothetical protein
LSSSNTPKVGDTVWIESDQYKGDATITYIDERHLYVDHYYPIQVEIPEENLDQFEDFNHGQTMCRFSLKEVLGIQTPDNVITEDEQGSLFDDY